MNVPQDPAANSPENQQVLQKISAENAQVLYSNFCRGTLTPEEIILDLGFNPNAFGVKVLEEDLDISSRVIMSPTAAKRLLILLNDMIQKHEANFGEVEIDFRRRLKGPGPTNGTR